MKFEPLNPIKCICLKINVFSNNSDWILDLADERKNVTAKKKLKAIF